MTSSSPRLPIESVPRDWVQAPAVTGYTQVLAPGVCRIVTMVPVLATPSGKPTARGQGISMSGKATGTVLWVECGWIQEGTQVSAWFSFSFSLYEPLGDKACNNAGLGRVVLGRGVA